jgi:hypothetical protein
MPTTPTNTISDRRLQEVLASRLPPSQAAARLGISGEYLTYLTKRGRLHPLVTPLGRLYHPDDVEKVRQEREEATRGKA